MAGSSHSEPQTDSSRDARLRRVLEEYLARLAANASGAESDGQSTNPNLLPELEEDLSKLRTVASLAQPAPSGPADATIPRHAAPRLASPSVGDALHLRCPHCQHRIELVDDTLLSDITCPSCGSSFSLLGTTDTKVYDYTDVKTLGHFELIDKLGMGQFGTVWMARDLELDRTVAVKVPRKGQLDPTETEQFLREARAAAQLRHPNIVSVHEVGRHEDTVYIVSDFVQGATLADWLTGQRLTTREAAQLCLKLAEALHHAHEAGVVHRDLKPSNIMLDTAGEPHIMDFGLAKREAGEVTMTIDGRILGTPSYMSPEQARGEGHHADRRSDVYSLGVILFQLLTGELPFRGNTRMLVLQILNEEPPSPRKLNSSVPRDLETICLKCLEKDPQRRYPTARELAAELQRYLHGEPIHSRAVGRWERTWRWAKRNPRMAALWAAVFLLLSATAVISTLSAWRIAAARDREVDSRRRAEAISIQEKAQRGRAVDAEQAARTEADRANLQAAVAQRVSEILAGMYQGADPVGLSGYSLGAAERVDVNTTALQILDRSTLRVKDDTAKLEKELAALEGSQVPDKLAVPLAVQAKLMDTIGSVYTTHMRFNDAEPLLVKALELRRRLFDARSLEVGESLHNTAVFHFFEGDFDAAEKLAVGALSIRREKSGENDLNVALSEFALAWAINFNLGSRHKEAEALMRSALQTRLALLGKDHRDTGYARFGLAVILFKVDGRQAEALKELLAATDIITRASGDKRIGEVLALYGRGLLAQGLKDYKGMEEANRRAVAKLAEVFGEQHPVVSYIKRDQADALVSRGNSQAAEKLYRESLESDRRLLGRRPFVGQSIAAFAKFLEFEHRFDEAELQYVEAIDILTTTLGADSGQVAVALHEAAGNDILRGDYASATQRCLESGRIFSLVRPEVRATRAEHTWNMLARVGFATDDLKLYRRACGELTRIHTEESSPEFSKSIAYTCTWAPDALPDIEVAVRLARRAQASLNSMPWAQQDLGCLLYRAGRYDEAVQTLSESIARQGADGTFLSQIFMAMCKARLGKKAEALSWLQKAEPWHASRVEFWSHYPESAQTSAAGSLAGETPRKPHPFAKWDETVLFGKLLQEARSIVRGESSAAQVPSQ